MADYGCHGAAHRSFPVFHRPPAARAGAVPVAFAVALSDQMTRP
ncbi:hypothetical protein ACFH04_15600 [Streptomyces noboritoensis]|uniref:Uncharacterized protein n=1 Tax=Streptomyces noboritoensis TaxID=67337 RepID=A0ABV6TH59_9ACTN